MRAREKAAERLEEIDSLLHAKTNPLDPRKLLSQAQVDALRASLTTIQREQPDDPCAAVTAFEEFAANYIGKTASAAQSEIRRERTKEKQHFKPKPVSSLGSQAALRGRGDLKYHPSLTGDFATLHRIWGDFLFDHDLTNEAIGNAWLNDGKPHTLHRVGHSTYFLAKKNVVAGIFLYILENKDTFFDTLQEQQKQARRDPLFEIPKDRRNKLVDAIRDARRVYEETLKNSHHKGRA